MSIKIDNNVFKILEDDGIENIDFKNENNLIYDIHGIIKKNQNLKIGVKELLIQKVIQQH